MRPLTELVGASVSTARMRTALLGLFAGLALVLAVVGTYGVIALAVSQRAREMGIRVALGASSRDILRLVVGGGLKPILVGAATGLAGAVAVSRLLGGLLFRVSPGDPTAFALAAVVILFSGTAAT